MHNPNADSTAKIPLYMPKLDWARQIPSPGESDIPAITNFSSAPVVITSGSPGYDGTTDPGPAGEPV